MDSNNDKTIKLQLYLSRCGIGSRRTCEAYIADGLVTVNGEIINKQGCRVSESDVILFNGMPVTPGSNFEYIALHKPKGVVCTNSDPENRPKAIDLLSGKVKSNRLFNVGRLDMYSSGLLIFTNDGDFAKIVTHPRYEIEKEYLVTAGKPIPKKLLKLFSQGITIEGVTYTCLAYSITNDKNAAISLKEGKNREIRRVFEYADIPIKDLCRVRIGSVRLGTLGPREFRYLTRDEVLFFKTRGRAPSQ